MPEAISNVGSASHLGENQLSRDSHFVYDYSRRRVPMPIISYLAVADTEGSLPPGENPGKKALDMLRDLIEPAVIAEEELTTEYMRTLINDALTSINTALGPKPDIEPPSPGVRVSLTLVITTTDKAFIGHIGTTRVRLLHNDRLYDLVPRGAAAKETGPLPPPREDMPMLFPMEEGRPTPDQQTGRAGGAQTAEFLGQAEFAHIGYNEVEISPEDTIILCTDGFWKNVSDEELVENLLSAMNVQRSANQLVRLAFSRDTSDNATMVAWQYSSFEGADFDRVPGRAARINKSRIAEFVLISLLALVLVGIFTVGFAFGWRITDAFRKPSKEAALKVRRAKAAAEEKKKAEEEAKKAAQSQAAAQAAPKPATIKGQGVRMRVSPDTNSELVGQLSDGQQVTVLGEVTGTDTQQWYRVKATVKIEGEQREVEGYVRNDFLEISQ